MIASLMRVALFLTDQLIIANESQASEGMWGMPGHTEARKAVVSCDKPGGGAHIQ